MKNISVVLLILSITSFSVYNFIGSNVDENGILVEPFYLLPIGYKLLFTSILIFILHRTKVLFK
ncbi:MAG: DUF3955 domain-containing protein [Bacteroidota bacterium]|nr:DUF3955 domain-containing protein [Bacteroidota bacterium]